jgi:hypothetical protein
MTRIYPSWHEIEQFRNPLEPGERHLAEFLDKNLPDGWDIYVQPFLNGDRPDIVIMNPKVGVMIYEVKDWNLEHYCRDDGRICVEDGSGEYEVLNPIDQVNHYRNNIIGLYMPQIGEEVDGDQQAFAVVRTGVYFHNANTEHARELVGEPRDTVVGRDGLTPKNLAKVVPDATRRTSQWMNDEWAAMLRNWLIPPLHAAEQNNPLSLNNLQLRYSEPQPGHHRLRGVAGSGKTAVLARRAARLASEGKSVLIVCFNITLWHYIHDLVQRVPLKFDRKLIEYRHFHGFCWRVFARLSWPKPMGEGEPFYHSKVPRAVLAAIQAKGVPDDLQYDAILIDEGQDFHPEWYDMLCHFLGDRDELMLVADKRQNIYRRDQGWTDGKMQGVKFRGPWAELKHSVRLPPLVAEQANRFGEQFLRSDTDLALQSDGQTGFMDPELWWANCRSLDEARDQAWAAYAYITGEKGHQPTDVVILVHSHKFGWELVERFNAAGIRVNHVFEDPRDEDRKRNKRSFWMGDSRLKMSTVHSFKGWELANVILIVPPEPEFEGGSEQNQAALAYTALTRMVRQPERMERPGCLIVLNCSPRFQEYGRGWPRQWTVQPVVWPTKTAGLDTPDAPDEPDWLKDAPPSAWEPEREEPPEPFVPHVRAPVPDDEGELPF